MFLDHNMKLCKMIELYLKYNNMHTIRTVNAFICINNHVNLCINSMLSVGMFGNQSTPDHVLRMQGLQGCDHLDNRGDRHNDGHLLCLSHLGGSLSSSCLESVGHYVVYWGTGATRNDTSMGWVITSTCRVLGRRLMGP